MRHPLPREGRGCVRLVPVCQPITSQACTGMFVPPAPLPLHPSPFLSFFLSLSFFIFLDLSLSLSSSFFPLSLYIATMWGVLSFHHSFSISSIPFGDCKSPVNTPCRSLWRPTLYNPKRSQEHLHKIVGHPPRHSPRNFSKKVFGTPIASQFPNGAFSSWHCRVFLRGGLGFPGLLCRADPSAARDGGDPGRGWG